MIQLFRFLSDSVDIILLLSTLQWGGFFPPFMVLPDLFMFAPDKWESGQANASFASLFSSVGCQGFKRGTRLFYFLQIFLSTVYGFPSPFQTGVPRVAPC